MIHLPRWVCTCTSMPFLGRRKEVNEWLEEQEKAAKKLKTTPSRSASSSGPHEKTKRWTAPPQATSWTSAMARSFGPPTMDFNIGRTPGQGRWFASYKGTDPSYRSYSWRLWGGEDECVRLCLKWAWERHECVTGTPCTGTDCPVEDIFI